MWFMFICNNRSGLWPIGLIFFILQLLLFWEVTASHRQSHARTSTWACMFGIIQLLLQWWSFICSYTSLWWALQHRVVQKASLLHPETCCWCLLHTVLVVNCCCLNYKWNHERQNGKLKSVDIQLLSLFKYTRATQHTWQSHVPLIHWFKQKLLSSKVCVTYADVNMKCSPFDVKSSSCQSEGQGLPHYTECTDLVMLGWQPLLCIVWMESLCVID